MIYNKYVKFWLLIGVIMLFVQIIVGGITRLTGSGLSITKWEIVTGAFPPTTNESWTEEFNEYKATPQYSKINKGMSLSEFKFIYFWEYIHRLWARLMGFVFLFPFMFFLFKKWIDPPLVKKLSLVILLAILAASFGWIMVASGLINRPWVNAYKLALHLCIGIAVYGVMFWTYLFAIKVKRIKGSRYYRKWGFGILMVLILQLFIGGIMSGMKAGLFYPTWPDMNGNFIPPIIFNGAEWTVENFNLYENSLLLPALVQFIHRLIAYILIISGLYYFFRVYKSKEMTKFRPQVVLFITLLITQVVLGIITIWNCIGSIPVLLGVLHQGTAILLLSSVLIMNFALRDSEN